MKINVFITAVSAGFIFHSAFAFEGCIQATFTRDGLPVNLLYTASPHFLRVENTATNWPNPVDLIDLPSGKMTLLFPNNRSFTHLPPAGADANLPAPGAMPQPMPPSGRLPGVGPHAATPPPGAPAIPQLPQMPTMPMMPMPMEKLEVKATGETTNLLGYSCARYEIKQRGEMMTVWATEQLFPYQPYVQNQRHRFGPQMIAEKWGGLLAEKKLFPLLATLRFDDGAERCRFEVTKIESGEMTDDDAKLFLPPPDYTEMQPLPF